MFFPLFVLTKTLLNVEKHYQNIKTIFKQYLSSCTSSICIYLKRVGNKYFFLWRNLHVTWNVCKLQILFIHFERLSLVIFQFSAPDIISQHCCYKGHLVSSLYCYSMCAITYTTPVTTVYDENLKSLGIFTNM